MSSVYEALAVDTVKGDDNQHKVRVTHFPWIRDLVFNFWLHFAHFILPSDFLVLRDIKKDISWKIVNSQLKAAGKLSDFKFMYLFH